MNRALEKNGFPALETEAYRDKVGWGIRRLALLCVKECTGNNAAQAGLEEAAARAAEDAIKFYAEAPLVFTKPYPGIAELIPELSKRKTRLAVLTNKPDSITQVIVKGLFPSGFFTVIRGEAPARPRKPDPACVWDILLELDLSPADVIFAGDSEVDIQTAVSSGCFPLGVSWGYRSRPTIEKAGARRIIDKPEELLELL
jgi:phosphoglycolate phosphatase